jgi:signal transduction histidine kinase
MSAFQGWLPNTDQDLRADDSISTAGRVKLLEMTYARILFGVTVIPVVALPLVWFYARSSPAAGLAAWGGMYVVFAVVLHLLHRAYSRDKGNFSAAQVLAKWQPRLEKIALLHGAGLSTPAMLTAGAASFEFALLLYITIAAITSANATHQTPVLGVFLRFFATGWNFSVVLMYWVFPSHWQFVMPLALVFSLVIYRHALIAHRFFVRQIRLEEHSVQLAEQYKTAKEEAEAALQAKNQFLTTASHDLRQPVHAMGLLIEAVNLRNADPALTPLLADLQSSVRSVNVMFNSLLDLSKLEAGITAAHPQPIDLALFMRDIATLFKEEARARRLQLRFRWPRTPVLVSADPALLQQAVTNLLHNALRYTQTGGVLVGARQRGNTWQVEVWDTGMGVADEDLLQIYSPFYRNRHAWRIDSAGHGLGLSVVARCAKLMGASYGLTSRLGRGSRFWLRLPAAKGPHQAAPIVWGANARQLPSRLQLLCGRCLVLEDDPQASAAWGALLKTWGVQARLATSAREAFAALDDGFEPQVILCDQRLRSGESGFEILCALQKRCPGAHGAMVSGEFNSPDLVRAENEGYLVLRKPLETSDLHSLLSQWLSAAPD